MQANPMEQNYQDQLGFVDKENAEEEVELSCYENCLHVQGNVCGFIRTWVPCLCCVQYPYVSIPQENVGLMQRYGKYIKTVKPGLQYVNACTETINFIDVRTNIIDLATQTIITNDNLVLNIDASVFYRVTNPRKAIYCVQDINKAIQYLIYASLRNICGVTKLQDLLEKRQELSDKIELEVRPHINQWGVKLEEVFVKDIILSKNLQENLSKAAKEKRYAEAKIISAKADVDSALLLKQASEILNSKAAMQIRYLETLGMITKNSSTKIVFLPNEQDKQSQFHKITQGLFV